MQSKVTYRFKLIICLFVSIALAFAPFDVKMLDCFHIEKSKACAVTPVADAVGFIEEAAQASTLTTAEYVATIVGIVAANGFNVSATSAVSMGNTLAQNLASIAPTDDYPEWSSLSSSEQTSWVSEENYNAARFNGLMTGFGLGDAYDRWNEGGGSHAFTSTEQGVLDQISSIGENWLDGISNTVEDLRLAVNGQNFAAFMRSYLGENTYEQIDASNISGYPYQSLSTPIINKGTSVHIDYSDNKQFDVVTDNDVYYWISMNSNYRFLNVTLFSENQFTYNYQANASGLISPSSTATPRNSNGRTYYAVGIAYNWNVTYLTLQNSTMVVNQNVDDTYYANRFLECVPYLLFEGSIDIGGDVDQIQGYPESDIESGSMNTVNIYFPPGGITQDTNWDDLLTYQEIITDDLSGIIILLQRIDSDLNTGFGRFLFNNDNYLLVKDSAIYNALSTFFAKFHFSSDNELLVHDLKVYNLLSSYVSAFNTWKSLFSFYNTGELKVHDLGVYTELSDIYSLLMEISGKMSNWGDVPDAPDIIGDFDFDDISDRVPNLLEVIENVAPFGAMLILTELYTVISSVNPIDDPEFVVPFQFGGLDDNQEVTIDLSWMDDIKPVINFFCILLLLLAMTRVTMRIVELEAAS